mgnify:CR=1 FL=1
MKKDEIITLLNDVAKRYNQMYNELAEKTGTYDSKTWQELRAISEARYILWRLPQVVNCPDCGRMYDTDYLHFCGGDECVVNGGGAHENGNV